MKSLRIAAGVAAVLLVVVGCGGGGGGGSGGFAIPTSGGAPSAPPPPPAAAAESKVVLTVELGGAAATADSTGSYVAAPGKYVVVKASEAVTWAGGSPADAVKAIDYGTTSTQWAALFSNSDAGKPVVYTLVAKDANGLEKAARFSVQPGNASNGTFTVFAANGSRQSLDINFDLGTYGLTDRDGRKMTGTLSPPSGEGTSFSARSPLATQVNPTSLVPKADSIVGALPLPVFGSAPTAYAAFPVIATRSFVTVPADLDGVFDRFRVDATATGRDSFIGQIEISGGGTLMTQCVDNVIYRIALCPSGSKVVTNIAADTEVGLWRLLNVNDGSITGRFAIALVDGEKTYLSAGPSGTSAIFAVGLPASTSYLDFNSLGWSTEGTIDLSVVSPGQYYLATTGPNGVPGTAFALQTIGTNGPFGMRVTSSGGKGYFFIRSRTLELMIGARSNVSTQGFMHIGIPR